MTHDDVLNKWLLLECFVVISSHIVKETIFRSHKKQKINTKVIYNDLLVKNKKEAHELKRKKEKGMTKANQKFEVVVLEDES